MTKPILISLSIIYIVIIIILFVLNEISVVDDLTCSCISILIEMSILVVFIYELFFGSLR